MGEQFGRYVLRRRLGVGGMAEVYEAVAYYASQAETTDPSSPPVEKPLVIKRILEEHSKNDDFRSMFVDEARIAMRLSHPNVVQVFDFGKADDRYFLAMELVKGRDLAAILARAEQRQSRVPYGVALFVVSEVAKGLDYAHRLASVDGKPLGLVHRDVSPQNILVSTEGAVKIGDFGIAKFNQRREMTAVMTVRGKVRYMSPEQVESETLDARSDLFALGVVLYEVVCGRPAFDGKTDLEVLDQVRRGATPKPSALGVPAELERVILKMMAREPVRRFARGNDVQRELERAASALGERFSSGAVAEYLNELFPEIEHRLSEPTGVTEIRRLRSDLISAPPAAPPEEETGTSGGIRRYFEEDGLPVFISEEVHLGEVKDTRETATRGAPELSGETTRVKERPELPPEPEATVPPPVLPRSSRRAEPTRPTNQRAVVPAAVDAPGTKGRTRPRATVPPPSAPVGAVTAAPWGAGAAPEPRASAPGTDMRIPLALAVFLGVATFGIVLMRFTPAGARIGAMMKHGSTEDPPLIVAGNKSDGGKTETGSFGYLILVGRDGDEVTVDSTDLGPLPLAPIRLEAGPLHEITVLGKDGYQITFGQVVDPGKTVTKTVR